MFLHFYCPTVTIVVHFIYIYIHLLTAYKQTKNPKPFFSFYFAYIQTKQSQRYNAIVIVEEGRDVLAQGVGRKWCAADFSV